MMKNFTRLLSTLLFATSALLLGTVSGCGEEQKTVSKAPDPIVIHNGEECDLCGMYINRFPGPKAQAFVRGGERALRFCSTRDMFAYALQPEHSHRVEHIYVHDVATAPWDSQEKASFIDAKAAVYVVGHDQRGAMGPALASFARVLDAELFAKQHGGKIVSYDQVNLELLSQMNHQAMH